MSAPIGSSGLPNLIFIIPSSGLCGHPKCKLFITHGGLFSHHEAIYSGVPTVGIPFFADQMYNVQYNVHTGRGVKLEFNELSEKSLSRAIYSVLDDSKYKETAERIACIYKDQPMSPSDTAMFWIEYVLRHKGAPHLKPAAASLTSYQLILFDVLTTFLLILVGLIVIIKFLVQVILYMISNVNGPVFS